MQFKRILEQHNCCNTSLMRGPLVKLQIMYDWYFTHHDGQVSHWIAHYFPKKGLSSHPKFNFPPQTTNINILNLLYNLAVYCIMHLLLVQHCFHVWILWTSSKKQTCLLMIDLQVNFPRWLKASDVVMLVISVQPNPRFVNGMISTLVKWTHEPSVHSVVLFLSCFTWNHMCTKCTIRLLRRGISCLPTCALRGCVCAGAYACLLCCSCFEGMPSELFLIWAC